MTGQQGKMRDRAEAATAQRRASRPQGEQPGAEVAALEPVPGNLAFALLKGWRKPITEALPRGQDGEGFIRMAATLMAASPQASKLVECTRPSLYTALMQAAHYGLMPFTDEAAIVPYGDQATFQPQYQGFIKLAFNSGQVASVTAKLIYKRDAWDIAYGPSGGGFLHKPLLFDDDGEEVPRGRLGADFQVLPGPGEDNPPILAYCYATFRDGASTEVEFVTRQDAIETRDRHSKAYANAEQSKYGKPPKRDSFWHTDPDKAWLKTAVRRAMKYIPKSAALLELILADNAADSTNGARAPWTPPPAESFTPGGPAAAWPGDVSHGDGTVVEGEVIRDPGDDEQRAADLARIGALFAQYGWGDPDDARHAEVRRAVAANMIREDDQAPYPAMESLDTLTAGQAARVAATLAEFSGRKDPHRSLSLMAGTVLRAWQAGAAT